MECVTKIEALIGKKIETRYNETARKGDHLCYISDLSKLRSHYPGWKLTYSLDRILEEIIRG